jgi:hypothetical protein
MFSKLHVIGTLLLALIIVLGGCQAQAAVPAATAQTAIPKVTFIAEDGRYTGPDTLPSGWVRLHLRNEGPAYDHIQLLKLDDGKTMDDLSAALAQDPAWPDWVAMYGGPNAPDPGQSSMATVLLDPGNYVLLSWIPDKQGVPHYAQGMMKAVTVVEAETVATPEPAADVTLDFVDFNYVLSQPFTAGRQTIRVNNGGSHPHEVWVARLAPGKSVADLFAALAPDAPADAWDSHGLGGITEIEPGAHAYFEVELEAGHYALLCFVFDQENRAPHAAMGMVQEFIVE